MSFLTGQDMLTLAAMNRKVSAEVERYSEVLVRHLQKHADSTWLQRSAFESLAQRTNSGRGAPVWRSVITEVTKSYMFALEDRPPITAVMCVVATETLVITGSRDTMIRVWDLPAQACLRTLRGHTAGVNVLSIASERFLVSSSFHPDVSFRIWDTEDATGVCNSIVDLHQAA